MTETAVLQLRRILALIPACADDRSHSIAELAARTDTTPATLLSDVRVLTDRFDDPGGFVEAVQVLIDRERLEVRSSHFLRPMRLTVAELAALDVGLSILASERPPEEQPAIRGSRNRLEAALARLPRDAVPATLRHAEITGVVDAAILARLRQSYRDSRKVRIGYRKAEQLTPSTRIVCPFAILFASGRWYLVGQCDGGEGLRVFRVDRIETVELLEQRYRVPESFQVSEIFRDGRAFASPVVERVQIRFAPRAARWIAEREGKSADADGGYVQEMPLADPDWVVRYVLQYGAEAEVIGPPEVRRAVAERLSRIIGDLDSRAEPARPG